VGAGGLAGPPLINQAWRDAALHTFFGLAHVVASHFARFSLDMLDTACPKGLGALVKQKATVMTKGEI
jgi:hypothetical protein